MTGTVGKSQSLVKLHDPSVPGSAFGSNVSGWSVTCVDRGRGLFDVAAATPSDAQAVTNFGCKEQVWARNRIPPLHDGPTGARDTT